MRVRRRFSALAGSCAAPNPVWPRRRQLPGTCSSAHHRPRVTSHLETAGSFIPTTTTESKIAMLNKAQLIDLVENQYFAQMDVKRLDETLACLAPDCVWRIYPAGVTLKWARRGDP